MHALKAIAFYTMNTKITLNHFHSFFISCSVCIYVPTSDYVRLNFGNEINSLAFADGAHFGLGLMSHQDFSTNKSALEWEYDSTCQSYDETASEMFQQSNLTNASIFILFGWILSGMTLLIVLGIKVSGKGSDVFCLCAFTLAVSLASTFSQELGLLSMFQKHGDDAVCSLSRYVFDNDGTSNWLVDYPATDYPEVAYMRFFQKCTLGTQGKMALAGGVLQMLTSVLIMTNYWVAQQSYSTAEYDGKDFSKEIDTAHEMLRPSNDNSPTNSVTRDLAVDEIQIKSPEESIVHDTPANDEEIMNDDISYDQPNQESFEDEIQAEDDLSMATTDVVVDLAASPAPTNLRSSLMSSKALSSGRF